MPADKSETTVTVSFWAIILVALGIFGFLFTSNINHEGRITILETQYTQINATLGKVEALSREIRDDQIRRQKREQ